MQNKKNLLNHVTSNGRICPIPKKWELIFDIIRNKAPKNNQLTPLILGGWNFSDDTQKRQRFIEQIEFAFSLDAETLMKFEESIYSCSESDWYKG